MIIQQSNSIAIQQYAPQRAHRIQPESLSPSFNSLSINKQQTLNQYIPSIGQTKSKTNEFTGINQEPQSQSLFSHKQRGISSKFLQSKIRLKFNRMTKINPKISSFMKNISQQIKTQVLNNYKPQIQSKQEEPPNTNLVQTQPLLQQIYQPPLQIIPDTEVVKNSCFRKMLVHSHVDNDIPSDEQDLNAGINYMYGELLYSVGSQIVNKRIGEQKTVEKKKIKTMLTTDSNKQNYDNNRVQLNSQSLKQNNLNKQKINLPKIRGQVKSKLKPRILSIRQ